MITPSPPSNPTKAQNDATMAQQLVAYGASLIKLHIPYVWGGTTTKGFDCSGFTQFVYKHFGYKIPRTAEEQAHVGTSVPRSALQPGDLLFYDITHANSHVAMYAGNGQQIVARHTGTFLQYQKVGNFSHAQRIIGTIPGGTVGGSSATPANNAVDPTGLFSSLIPTPQSVFNAIAESLGVPDIKDAIQRLGLILLGGGMLLYGIKLLMSQTINKAMGSSSSKPEEKTEQEEKKESKPKDRTRPIQQRRVARELPQVSGQGENTEQPEPERAVTPEETIHRAAQS